MKTKTLLCILMVLLIAFTNAQPPVDLKIDPPNTGQLLQPHIRGRDELMRRMHKRETGSTFSSLANTQPYKVNPLIQWQQSLGGSGVDLPRSIQQTKDGGYIVAGYSDSKNGNVSDQHGFGDYWIVKLSSSGTIQWQQSLGGSNYEEAYSIQQSNDGGYIVAGYAVSEDGDVSGQHGWGDYWIVKLSSTGTIEWQKSLGGTGGDVAHSIEQTNDGGYIVAGWSDSRDGDVKNNHGSFDYWIVKLNSTGVIEWQQSLGGSSYDFAECIQQTKDGGYVVAGESYSNDGDVSGNNGIVDYWIVKLNSTGVIEWQQSLGGPSYDVPYSIQQTEDGGYVVAGESSSIDGDVSGNHGNSDYWIVKLSSSGTIQWQRALGGSGGDAAYSIQQTKDGGYIVAGFTGSNDGDVSSNHGYYDYWIVKLGRSGNIQVEETFGGSFSDYCTSGCITKDYGYVVAGESESNDGDVSYQLGYGDYWIVKLKGLKSLLPAVEESTSSSNRMTSTKNTNKPLLHIQPNPSPNGMFIADISAVRNNVLVVVTNSSGTEVYAKQLSAAGQISINLNNQPKGIYYLQISYDGGKQMEKLVVQ